MRAAIEALVQSHLADAQAAQNPGSIALDGLDQNKSIEESEYRKSLKDLQQRLLKQQSKLLRSRHSLVVVAEGPDAAGKGGALNRMVEKLDPRTLRVHAITKPTAEELAHHYLWRFWTKLPPRGHICIFDRSWYGRVLVERVEGFAREEEWRRAYREINDFERLLTNDGVVVVKLYLHITKDEQLKRFNLRLENPSKAWKINEEDWRNRSKWEQHNAAAEDMMRVTSRPDAPWHVVAANFKWYARLQVIKRVVQAVEALGL
ncbi:MAG: UDP-galactose-lipid carrier transferase [Verrucomicrobia bacterium]|nr:UDP-galactose-lipid carrier transferase [Verrucomicrobiota bacterium]